MSGMLQATREQRNMPFLRRGMRCNMDGKFGNVTSGDITWLRVRFDGNNFSSNVHPTWQMTYYAEDGSVVKDYKQAK